MCSGCTGFVTPGLFLRVVVDGEVVTDGGVRVLQVAIGNGRFVAGGVPLLPAAVADDGRVDVVVSFAMSTPRRFVYALGARLGLHPGNPDVSTFRGSRVHVESANGFRWNADGEVRGPARRREWHVQPHAWTVLALPPDR